MDGPKIAVNGFGRIGRLVVRALRETGGVDLVAVNDLTDRETLAHLARHDSVHGHYGPVEVTDDGLVIDGDRLLVISEPDPENLPWEELGVDVVIEASGRFRKRGDLEKHLAAGAKSVLLSAPGEVDVSIVRGVNDDAYTGQRIVGAASCTTNCLANVLAPLDAAWPVQRGFITTVHAATNDQHVADAAHKDLRRARATLGSMIPTATGAAKAIGKVMPHLDGRLDGLAVRVPTLDVSLLDLVVAVDGDPTADDVRDVFRRASKLQPDLLGCEDAPLVSVDFKHDSRSAIIDMPTVATNGLVKVLAWYDNEWGYANRAAELAAKMGREEE